MATPYKKPLNGFYVLLLFGIVILAFLAIYTSSPYGKEDKKIIFPDVVKFLTTDGDTAYIQNYTHAVKIIVHKK